MAIFTSDDKQPNGLGQKLGAATIIAQGTKIKGEINTDCHLHIDGEFEGNIHAKDVVMVGKSGVVRGDVRANSLIVSGRFIGNVTANVLEIKPQGRVEGSVEVAEFIIERKGVFMGESKAKDPKASKADISSLELPKKDK